MLENSDYKVEEAQLFTFPHSRDQIPSSALNDTPRLDSLEVNLNVQISRARGLRNEKRDSSQMPKSLTRSSSKEPSED